MAEQYKSPGWYPDPDGKPGERWWNGAGWSDTSRGAPASAPAAARPNPYVQQPVTLAAPGPRSAFTIDARQNRLAVISFVLGLVGLFGFSVAGPAAVILGFMGIARARKLKAEGAQSNSYLVLATIGLVAGGISTFLLVVAIIGFVAATTFNYDPS